MLVHIDLCEGVCSMQHAAPPHACLQTCSMVQISSPSCLERRRKKNPTPMNTFLPRNVSFRFLSVAEITDGFVGLLRLSETLQVRKNNYSHIELGPQNSKLQLWVPSQNKKFHLFNEQSVVLGEGCECYEGLLPSCDMELKRIARWELDNANSIFNWQRQEAFRAICRWRQSAAVCYYYCSVMSTSVSYYKSLHCKLTWQPSS